MFNRTALILLVTGFALGVGLMSILIHIGPNAVIDNMYTVAILDQVYNARRLHDGKAAEVEKQMIEVSVRSAQQMDAMGLSEEQKQHVLWALDDYYKSANLPAPAELETSFSNLPTHPCKVPTDTKQPEK